MAAVWRFHAPSPPSDLRLTQITFDAGVTTAPAISPDGRTIAYVSDRDTGANLQLYIQRFPGGSPTRLTTGDGDVTDPSFSPDGSTLLFHSTSDRGGIYTVAAAGGDPHRFAAGGRAPRYSPDGHRVAFWRLDDTTGRGTLYLADASGGEPHPFRHAEFTDARLPCWSRDGRTILFRGHRENGAEDLWTAPLDGGAAEAVGIATLLDKAGIAGPLDDYTWTSDAIVFSGRTGGVRNLYRCPLDRHRKAAGALVRLTNGTETMEQPSAATDGRLVLASGRERFDIWGVPLDAENGILHGAPYRITDTLAPTSTPFISRDGGTLLFGCARNGFTQVWRKNLASGAETVAATGPEGATYGVLTPRGRILYVQPSGGQSDLYLLDGSGGAARKVAAGARAWDVDAQEQTALISGAGIEALDLSSGARAPLLRPPPGASLSHASFSPDGRWILFQEQTLGSARIYAARLGGRGEIPSQNWIAITDGRAPVDNPRFSPGGGLVYFTREEGGQRAIFAVRFDPHADPMAGEPFEICKYPAHRFSLTEVNSQALELGIVRDKMIVILREYTSNIWVADLVPH